MAVLAYTTFSTDTRVQKEAYAALELGYELDIYTLFDVNTEKHESFNFVSSRFEQYKGQSKFSYVWSYINFFIFCLFKLTINNFTKKYKFVHVHNMPNFLVFSTIFLKFRSAIIILDIHDLMPEIFSVKFKLPISHWLIRMLYLEEKLAANFANEIIATNSFHISRFKENGIKKRRITEVVNVADHNVFYEPKIKTFNEERLIISYPSTLAKRLGIDNLIEAIEILNNKKLNIHLNIYGDGEYRKEIWDSINKKKLNSLVSISSTFVSLERLSYELDKAHLGVIPLPSNVSNDIAMPVKIYEFFAKKVCVIASDLPLLKSCFNKSVVFFQAGNSNDLAKKIEHLYNNRGEIEEFALKGYRTFLNQTWMHYKRMYQSILNQY